jgi:bifunctional DNase/RNase
VLFRSAQVKIKEIKIFDLKDYTYYATIFLTINKDLIEVDARPSDAIALALRMQAPIFVDEEVIQKSKAVDLGAKEEIHSADGKKWTEVLEGLDPDDFGKYKM